MKSVSLSAYPRTLVKRSGVKKLRTARRVPAVVYGRQHPSQSLEVKLQDIENLLHHSASENILVDLNVEGDARSKRLALVQEIQHHALSGKVLHVDLHEVAETEHVSVTVPIEAVGVPLGVRESGGVLEHVLFRVKVRALPRDLPETIQADVTALNIGEAIHISDLILPPGTEIIGNKKTTVLAVAAPLSEEQLAAAEAAATEPGTEPEVIMEKKEEGEEGEAGKAPEKKGAEKASTEKKGAEKAPVEKKGAEKVEKKPEEKKAEKKAEKKR
jgi:large subunit ribosomal protein L25